MFDYSGLLFRVWGVAGIMLASGVVILLVEKPWVKGLRNNGAKLGIALVVAALIFGGTYLYRYLNPDISSYSGVYVKSYRNSRVAPPLPVTFEYCFRNEEDKQKVFYLDAFSEKRIMPNGLEVGREYTVYYEVNKKIIVRIE